MAPTVSEFGERRPPLVLEEHFHRALRLSSHNDPLRLRRNNLKSQIRLATVKVMGLVVEQRMREGDSPGLPSSNTISTNDRRQVKQDVIDITLRTMLLLRRNQILQKRLDALQMETRALARSAKEK